LAGVLSLAVLAGCSGNAEVADSEGEAKAGGTLRIASLNSDIDALDPLTGYSTDSWQVLRAITRQLVTFPGSPESLGDDT